MVFKKFGPGKKQLTAAWSLNVRKKTELIP